MQIDADVFENPDKFAGKYQAMRPEAEESTRKDLLLQEAAIISGFVNNGGLKALVTEAFRTEEPGLTEPAYDAKADEFLNNNFRLEGVQTEKPLNYATWEITSREGVFMARQEYKISTDKFDRSWQVGVDPELSALAQKKHTGAQQILEAVDHTRNLPKVDLTSGYALPNPASALDSFRNKPEPKPASDLKI